MAQTMIHRILDAVLASLVVVIAVPVVMLLWVLVGTRGAKVEDDE